MTISDQNSTTFNVTEGYELIIAADTSDYNVYDAFVAAYGTPSADVILNVTVNAGVVVSATTTATAGLTWGNSWTGTPTFTLVNLGYVIGKGGAGGAYVAPSYNYIGFSGGSAIELSGNTISITNASGSIWGGGGGGGGGSDSAFSTAIGGGGGGAGNGLGGVCVNMGTQPGFTQTRVGTSGEDATGSLISQVGVAGGVGELGYFSASDANSYPGDGNSGGDYGEPGLQGTQGYYEWAFDPGVFINGDLPGGTGGAAGKAINLTAGTANFVSGSGSPNVKGAVS